MNVKLALLSALFLWTGTQAFSQSRVGLSLSLYKTGQTGLAPSAGLTFEQPTGKRSSVEVGVYYRSSRDTGVRYTFQPTQFNYSGYAVTYSVQQRFLSVPLLYTYKTKVANLSVGATADFYLGWEEKSRRTEELGFQPREYQPGTTYLLDKSEVDRMVREPMAHYFFDHPTLFGLMFRVSKPISVGEKLVLEPHAFYNLVLTSYSINGNAQSDHKAFYGAGASVKLAL